MELLIVLGLSFGAWLLVCVVQALLRVPEQVAIRREHREWQRRVAEHELGERPGVTGVR
jgi:hypothetical protein